MTTPWPITFYGSSTHPAVVFLHGFMGRGEDWKEVAEKLSDRYYCICPDLPGHAKNINRPIDEVLNFEVISSELIQELDNLGLEKVNLIGYSMGGRIGLYMAVHYPNYVKKLVVENGNPGIEDNTLRQERAVLDDERANKLRKNGIDSFVDKWYQASLFDSLQNQPILLDKVLNIRKKNDPIWMAKVISELSPGRQKPLWKYLNLLKMPVMYLTGNLDDKYTEIQRRIEEVSIGKLFAVIPEAGHNVHLESLEPFLNTIERFLDNEFRNPQSAPRN